MKIAIRDDDLCYWSNYDDFISIYNELGIPVSASVTPFAVANHGDAFHFGDYPRDIEKCILENEELTKKLKIDVKNRKVEILLHGYSHQYKKVDGKWIAEMSWNNYEDLKKKIYRGKTLLEDNFNTKINTFVAPSQIIDKKGIKVISELNMNFSGMINRLKERKFSFETIYFLTKRFINRIKYGVAIQGMMKYRTPPHKEIGVVPITSLEELIRLYNIFKKNNWNMVIVTHYWQLIQNGGKLDVLRNFVSTIGKNNFTFVSNFFEV